MIVGRLTLSSLGVTVGQGNNHFSGDRGVKEHEYFSFFPFLLSLARAAEKEKRDHWVETAAGRY